MILGLLNSFMDRRWRLKTLLFSYSAGFLTTFLAERGERGVVMGATSGDTGSAAIEGARRSDHLDVVILHPYQRVSEVQRRQMTTVLSSNVHNVALRGILMIVRRL